MRPNWCVAVVLAFVTCFACGVETVHARNPLANRSLLACQMAPRSFSLGSPDDGSIEDARHLSASPGLYLRAGKRRIYYGSDELVAILEELGAWIRQALPEVPHIVVGDMSRRRGGPSRPHRSHQNGRDVDLGYPLLRRRPPVRFHRATPRTFDVGSTWRIFEHLLDSGWVEAIFIDKTLRKSLMAEARASGMSRRQARILFTRVIVHVDGHDDHFHLRIRDREEICPAILAAGDRAETP